MRRNLAFPIVFAMCSPMLAQTYTISTLAKTNSAAGVAGVAVDSSGVVYYSDGQQLKKMTPSGAVSVIAGVAFGALTTGQRRHLQHRSPGASGHRWAEQPVHLR
jgi:hypothetical protein